MHEDEESKNSPDPLAKLGYEESDFNAPKVAKGMLYFLLFSTGCIGFAWVILKFIAPDFWTIQPQISKLRIPPAPKLQNNVAVVEDIHSVRRREYQMINSYGWIDSQKGIVRIPIERAIDITLSRGLPTRPNAASNSILNKKD